MAGKGFEDFLKMAGKMRSDRLPETAKKWSALNAGYRRMVARQAGISDERAGLSLMEMTDQERKALMEANRRIAELAEEAHKILYASVIQA